MLKPNDSYLIAERLSSEPETPAPVIPGASLAEIQKYAILTTLASVGGSTGKAAKILGCSARCIQYKIHQYNNTTPNVRKRK